MNYVRILLVVGVISTATGAVVLVAMPTAGAIPVDGRGQELAGLALLLNLLGRGKTLLAFGIVALQACAWYALVLWLRRSRGPSS